MKTLLFLALMCPAIAGDFVPVDPPAETPFYAKSAKLGVCSALRVDFYRSPFSCGGCNAMQPAHSWMVWVPDAVRPGDSIESVMLKAQRTQYNGTETGWCLKCAPKLETDWEARRDAAKRRLEDRLREMEANMKPGETMTDVVGWGADNSGTQWEILRNGEWRIWTKGEQP